MDERREEGTRTDVVSRKSNGNLEVTSREAGFVPGLKLSRKGKGKRTREIAVSDGLWFALSAHRSCLFLVVTRREDGEEEKKGLNSPLHSRSSVHEIPSRSWSKRANLPSSSQLEESTTRNPPWASSAGWEWQINRKDEVSSMVRGKGRKEGNDEGWNEREMRLTRQPP